MGSFLGCDDPVDLVERDGDSGFAGFLVFFVLVIEGFQGFDGFGRRWWDGVDGG